MIVGSNLDDSTPDQHTAERALPSSLLLDPDL